MNRWMRPAEVNKKLIFVLVVLVLAAGGYWMCRSTPSDDGATLVDPGEKHALYCPGRDEPFMLTAAEAKELKEENDLFENPETGVCECSWNEPPRDDGVLMP